MLSKSLPTPRRACRRAGREPLRRVPGYGSITAQAPKKVRRPSDVERPELRGVCAMLSSRLLFTDPGYKVAQLRRNWSPSLHRPSPPSSNHHDPLKTGLQDPVGITAASQRSARVASAIPGKERSFFPESKASAFFITPRPPAASHRPAAAVPRANAMIVSCVIGCLLRLEG